MTTITREQVQKIIDAADEVITALAGTNDDVHPDNSTKMTQLYDDLNDHYAPPEVVRELARIALASLEAEPIGAFHIADQQVDGTSDYIKDGEWPIDNGVIEVYAAPPVLERERIRREHAEWSDKTFGDVGPVGPLKHLSKEALEAAADPSDPLEWADMQFLLWDAQRRAGITEEQIALAMVEKLAVNKKRQWPEPKDGEPRLHIKEQPAPEEIDERTSFNAWNNEHNLPIAGVGVKNAAWLAWQARARLCISPVPVMPAELHPDTQNLVANFSTALAEKLYKAQLKYGYDADWKQDGWHTQCLAHFHQHIAKGDPRDVAAYCAFMWYHGWKTESVSGPVVPEEITDESTEQRLMGRRWAHSFCAGWNACRAEMLNGGKS